jgi:Ca2+-binding RTX toxin-like protein
MASLIITGDAAANSVSYSGVVSGSVTANLGDGVDTFVAGATQAVIVHGEDGDDTLTGSSQNDSLFGEGGSDTLDGGAGDDLLLPGIGGGSTAGGTSTAAVGDTLSFQDVTAPPGVTADISLGTVTVPGDTQMMSGIENLKGSPGDDELIGDGAKNDLDGLGGDDLLRPGAGPGLNTGGSSSAAGDTVSYQDVAPLALPAVTVNANLNTNSATVPGGAQTFAGVENLTGSDGKDVLIGSDLGTNVLDGRDGDDLLQPRLGSGRSTGGPGIDTVSYQDVTPLAPPAVTVDANLDANTATVPGGGAQTFATVENLTGSPGIDVLTGSIGANDLDGLGGDDKLLPLTGAGKSTGGAGTGDTVSYENVTPFAAPLVTVNANLDTNSATVAGDGQMFAGVENLMGSEGNDVLIGSDGANDLDGRGGDDVLQPRKGSGQSTGGSGTDTVSYEDVVPLALPAVTVNANLNTNTATVPGGAQTFAGVENLTGSDGKDVLIGSDLGANELDGRDGDDLLQPRLGSGKSTGGPGIDTVSYQDVTPLAPPAVTVDANLDANTATVPGGGAQMFASVENLTGSPGNDVLAGSIGANDLDGLGGDDKLLPLTGAGKSTGGAGTDTVSYENVTPLAAPLVTVNANLDANTATVAGDGQTFAGVENLMGSEGNDVLIGSDVGANDLDGRGGDDVLQPRIGTGTSTGGAGIDTVSYQDVAGLVPPAVTVTASLDTNKATVVTDAQMFASVENLTGSPGNDVLTGDSGANDLDGLGGDDRLLPMTGAGKSTGGAGTADTVSYENVTPLAAPAVTVSASLDSNTATVVTDTQMFAGVENLTGSDGIDVLVGSDSANALDGRGGDDVLQPRIGTGKSTGGAGTDTVSYVDVSPLVPPVLTVSASLDTNTGSVAGDAQTYAGVENLTGSTGNDLLTGDSGANDLDGLSGADILRPMTGAGKSTGGPGIDLVSYENVAALIAPLVTVTASLDASSATVAGDAQTLATVENLGGSPGIDHLTGDANKNVLLGEAGDDVLDGLGDDDLLIPGSGAGSSTGGGGTDTVSYAGIAPLAPPAITMTVNLDAGTATGPGVNQTVSDVDNVTTGSGDDVLIGDAQSNGLDGGGGTDTVSYEDRVAGEDVVASLTSKTGGQTGTGEADAYASIENLRGGAGADTLTGDGAKNLLSGGAGADILDGQADDDVLMPGTGAGSSTGGPGTDTVSFADIPAAAPPALTVRADLDGGTAVVLGVTQTLSFIENVLGSAGDDLLIGADSVDNLLDGANGIDTISYEDRVGGENVIASLVTEAGGQTGTGEVDHYDNAENLTGGGGDDTLIGDGGPNVLRGNAGADALSGNGGADVLLPGSGAGNSSGGGGVDTVSFADITPLALPATTVFVNLAAAAAQVLGIGQTLDTVENVVGSAGNDVITGDTQNNVLDGGAGGTDLVWYADRTAAHPIVASLATNTGGELPEVDTYVGIENLRGGLGDDTLTGNSSNNALDGDDGVDTVSYNDRVAGQNVVASLAAGLGGQAGTGELDTYQHVENLTGGAGDDTLTGNGSSNKLDGATGNDTASYDDRGPGQDVVASLATGTGGQTTTPEADVYANIENLTGGGGNDTLSGNDANNVLDGGAGTDTVSYADRTAGEHVAASLATGSGGQSAIGEIDGYLRVENLLGGAGDDTLTGNGQDNVLIGALGDDTLAGGAGADVLSGEAGTDTASYAADSAGVDVSLDGSANDGIGGAAEGDNVVGTENVIGGAGPDRLTGSQAVNDLLGAGGDDTIIGKGGSDALDGGAGTDTVSYEDRGPGEGVSATLAGAGGGSGELDSLTSFERLLGGAGDDSLTGSDGNDEIRGGAGADVVAGAGGNDTLVGDDGPDVLSGGPGSDGLTGGSGNDRLDGGSEPDGFSAGPGDDDVSAFDGNAEDVSCGDGVDRVDQDVSDTFSAADCESRVVLGFVPPPFTLDPRARDRDRDGSFAGIDCNDFDETKHPGAPDIPGDGIDQNCDGADAPFPPIKTEFRLHFAKVKKIGTTVTGFELRRVPAGAKIVVTCKSKKTPRCVFASRSVTLKTARAKYSIRGYFGDRPLSNGSTIEVRVSAPKSIGRSITILIRKPGQNPKRTDGCLDLGGLKAVACT